MAKIILAPELIACWQFFRQCLILIDAIAVRELVHVAAAIRGEAGRGSMFP
jgi:hypothetical protein